MLYDIAYSASSTQPKRFSELLTFHSFKHLRKLELYLKINLLKAVSICRSFKSPELELCLWDSRGYCSTIRTHRYITFPQNVTRLCGEKAYECRKSDPVLLSIKATEISLKTKEEDEGRPVLEKERRTRKGQLLVPMTTTSSPSWEILEREKEKDIISVFLLIYLYVNGKWK